MELQSGAKILANARFVGAIYLYIGSECVKL